ncbi:hypothetical protein LINGRAPRIM_LOCUS3423, partial [Linum grandiflorum]
EPISPNHSLSSRRLFAFSFSLSHPFPPLLHVSVFPHLLLVSHFTHLLVPLFTQLLLSWVIMKDEHTPSNYKSSGSRNHLRCKHKHAAIVKVSKTKKNRGRQFFGCSFWKDDDCGFFKWSDDVVDCDSSCSNDELDSLK